MAIVKARELSNVDIVVYALFKLRGHERKVQTEEVAYKAFSLARERFSWRLTKFRDMGFPDKEPVRVALMDAAKPKNGHLVEGRAGVDAGGKESDGWTLTSAGAAWIRDNRSRIESWLGLARSSVQPREAGRFQTQLRNEQLFREFQRDGSLKGRSPYLLTDMLSTSPDASPQLIRAKFERLRAIAALVGDDQINNFLNACEIAFSDLLT